MCVVGVSVALSDTRGCPLHVLYVITPKAIGLLLVDVPIMGGGNIAFCGVLCQSCLLAVRANMYSEYACSHSPASVHEARRGVATACTWYFGC